MQVVVSHDTTVSIISDVVVYKDNNKVTQWSHFRTNCSNYGWNSWYGSNQTTVLPYITVFRVLSINPGRGRVFILSSMIS